MLIYSSGRSQRTKRVGGPERAVCFFLRTPRTAFQRPCLSLSSLHSTLSSSEAVNDAALACEQQHCGKWLLVNSVVSRQDGNRHNETFRFPCCTLKPFTWSGGPTFLKAYADPSLRGHNPHTLAFYPPTSTAGMGTPSPARHHTRLSLIPAFKRMNYE